MSIVPQDPAQPSTAAAMPESPASLQISEIYLTWSSTTSSGHLCRSHLGSGWSRKIKFEAVHIAMLWPKTAAACGHLWQHAAWRGTATQTVASVVHCSQLLILVVHLPRAPWLSRNESLMQSSSMQEGQLSQLPAICPD